MSGHRASTDGVALRGPAEDISWQESDAPPTERSWWHSIVTSTRSTTRAVCCTRVSTPATPTLGPTIPSPVCSSNSKTLRASAACFVELRVLLCVTETTDRLRAVSSLHPAREVDSRPSIRHPGDVFYALVSPCPLSSHVVMHPP